MFRIFSLDPYLLLSRRPNTTDETPFHNTAENVAEIKTTEKFLCERVEIGNLFSRLNSSSLNSPVHGKIVSPKEKCQEVLICYHDHPNLGHVGILEAF